MHIIIRPTPLHAIPNISHLGLHYYSGYYNHNLRPAVYCVLRRRRVVRVLSRRSRSPGRSVGTVRYGSPCHPMSCAQTTHCVDKLRAVAATRAVRRLLMIFIVPLAVRLYVQEPAIWRTTQRARPTARPAAIQSVHGVQLGDRMQRSRILQWHERSRRPRDTGRVARSINSSLLRSNYKLVAVQRVTSVTSHYVTLRGVRQAIIHVSLSLSLSLSHIAVVCCISNEVEPESPSRRTICVELLTSKHVLQNGRSQLQP